MTNKRPAGRDNEGRTRADVILITRCSDLICKYSPVWEERPDNTLNGHSVERNQSLTRSITQWLLDLSHFSTFQSSNVSTIILSFGPSLWGAVEPNILHLYPNKQCDYHSLIYSPSYSPDSIRALRLRIPEYFCAVSVQVIFATHRHVTMAR